MMGQLPRGITGFFEPPTDHAPPLVDIPAFKAVCYRVARRAGGEVVRVEVNTGKVEPNYHVAVLHLPQTRLAVLCNAHYPLLGFTDQADTRYAPLHFTAAPELSSHFYQEVLFTPLAVAYLQTMPYPELLANLSSVEQAQIRSWCPTQVGDIVFNHWD